MDQNQIYDKQTIEVMKRALRPDSNAIDVGCHRGSMLLEILNIAPEGQHLAFEALPDMFELLKADYDDNPHVRLYNLALNDVSGIVSFQHVLSNPGYSGLRQRQYDRDNEQVIEIQVRSECLDAIVDGGTDIRFIKIDVEGAELQVLRGAVGTITRCAPLIVFEHGLGAADRYGTNPEDVFDLLKDCELRCFTMAAWLASGGTEALSRETFSDDFRSGRNYYFLAGR